MSDQPKPVEWNNEIPVVKIINGEMLIFLNGKALGAQIDLTVTHTLQQKGNAKAVLTLLVNLEDAK